MSFEDAFKTSSGLPDDFVASIAEPVFKFHEYKGEIPKDSDGNPIPPPCVLSGVLKSETEDVDDQELRLKCGGKWIPADGGRRTEREDGKNDTFHQNSYIGTVIDALMELGPNAVEAFRARYEELGGKGPDNAEWWDGWRFHWIRKEFGEGEFKRQWLVPDAYMGRVDDGTSAPKQVEKVEKVAAESAPTPAPAAKGKTPKAESGAQHPLYSQLFDLAYNADDFDAYKAAAYEKFEAEAADEAAVVELIEGPTVWNAAVEKWSQDNG